MTHACDPNTQGMEAGRSGVSGHPRLHSEFKATLGSVRPRLEGGDEVFRIDKKCCKWTSDLILLAGLAKASSHPIHLVHIVWLMTHFLAQLSAEGCWMLLPLHLVRNLLGCPFTQNRLP